MNETEKFDSANQQGTSGFAETADRHTAGLFSSSLASPKELISEIVTPKNLFKRKLDGSSPIYPNMSSPESANSAIARQLRNLSYEIKILNDKLKLQEIEREVSSKDNSQIKEILKRLENSVVDLGGHVDDSMLQVHDG
jgi:hypothetical protein